MSSDEGSLERLNARAELLRLAAVRYQAIPLLTESLLHDVRNPLNALSINLEVLREKLKLPSGEVPATQDKNLRAMRDQVFRVDALLRLFAEFMFTRPSEGAGLDVSEQVARALQVAGHESRRRHLKVRTELAPELRVKLPPESDLPFLLLQPLLGAFQRAGEGGEIQVSLQADPSSVLYQVTDSAGQPGGASPELYAALAHVCDRLGVALDLQERSCRLTFARGA